MLPYCPGALSFKQPQPEEVSCPSCGYVLEMWTDEAKADCPKCKHAVLRTIGQSCLDWCKYAQDCVGVDAFRTYVRGKKVLMKDSLLKELEAFFGSDTRRINHATEVMDYANELLKDEKADWHIVIPASILHDIGIKAAEAKYGLAAAGYQEAEGPAIAREILLRLGFKKDDVDEICQIIAHHHSPGVIDTHNFRVLYDADWLVNLRDEPGIEDKQRLAAVIEKVFLTGAGKALAKKVYLAYL